ncbi:hypothetical protein E1285_18105 [Actinomadura sp. 7K507]|nr:hypothetical protein E1285_18105 [Actinomadura sp. 7K507]
MPSPHRSATGPPSPPSKPPTTTPRPALTTGPCSSPPPPERCGPRPPCWPSGQLTRYGAALRDPHGPLVFAAAERSSWPNSMEGALESGRTAAAQTRALLSAAR